VAEGFAVQVAAKLEKGEGPLEARLARLIDLPDAGARLGDASATTLLGDPAGAEASLLVRLGSPWVRKVPALPWGEALKEVVARRWLVTASKYARALAGITPASLPQVVSRLAELGKTMGEGGAPIIRSADAERVASQAIGAALGFALLRHGATLDGEPGFETK